MGKKGWPKGKLRGPRKKKVVGIVDEMETLEHKQLTEQDNIQVLIGGSRVGKTMQVDSISKPLVQAPVEQMTQGETKVIPNETVTTPVEKIIEKEVKPHSEVVRSTADLNQSYYRRDPLIVPEGFKKPNMDQRFVHIKKVNQLGYDPARGWKPIISATGARPLPDNIRRKTHEHTSSVGSAYVVGDLVLCEREKYIGDHVRKEIRKEWNKQMQGIYKPDQPTSGATTKAFFSKK